MDVTTIKMEEFYLIHLLLSGAVSLIPALFLKTKFTTSFRLIWFFFAVFNLVLPVVGYFLSVWLTYYLLTVRYEKTLKNIESIDMNEFDAEFPEINRLFGEASMETILNDEEIAGSMKMRALVSIADNVSQNDVKLIKNSLSNKNDEIRLYSFALIDDMERNINGKIYENVQKFNETEEVEVKREIAETLSYLYWDMIDYDLADADLQIFILEEVERYSKLVLEHNPHNIRLNMILGKVYLREDKFEEAEKCFAIAMEDGLLKTDIVAYLAEIRYKKRDFAGVKALLEREAKALEFDLGLYPLSKQWS